MSREYQDSDDRGEGENGAVGHNHLRASSRNYQGRPSVYSTRRLDNDYLNPETRAGSQYAASRQDVRLRENPGVNDILQERGRDPSRELVGPLRSEALASTQLAQRDHPVNPIRYSLAGNPRRTRVIDIHITINPNGRTSQALVGSNNSTLLRSTAKFDNVHVVNLDFRPSNHTLQVDTDGYRK